MRKVRLLVINDNVPAPGLKNDWGWSVYIDMDDKSAIFDADTRPDILRHNIEKMGVEIGKTEFCVLSHHHWDHYGGFQYIGEVKPGLKVYVPPGNVDFLRKWRLDPVVVNKPQEIMDDVWISGPARSSPFGIREIAMGIRIDNTGLVVIVGCSHPGVDKLSAQLMELSGEEIFLVIGGYHSPSKKSIDRLASISRFMCPAHCSGDPAKRYVMEKYGDKYVEVRTGSEVIVENKEIKVMNAPYK